MIFWAHLSTNNWVEQLVGAPEHAEANWRSQLGSLSTVETSEHGAEAIEMRVVLMVEQIFSFLAVRETTGKQLGRSQSI